MSKIQMGIQETAIFPVTKMIFFCRILILRQIIMILDWNTAMRQMTRLQLIQLMQQRSTK